MYKLPCIEEDIVVHLLSSGVPNFSMEVRSAGADERWVQPLFVVGSHDQNPE